MAQLKDLLDRPGDDKVFVAAFPLEDKDKTLAEIFPASWVNQVEQTQIFLLQSPPQIVKDLCMHMYNAGAEYLKEYFESKIPDLEGLDASEGHNV